ncbi:MAG: hypothetical protein ABEJ79_01735 [Halolamina sp.]
MPSSAVRTFVTAVRVVAAAAGVAVAVLTVGWLAGIPEPPPGSDGFAYGMAGAVGGFALLVALTAVAGSVLAPTVLGLDDPLGFGRYQRLALSAAAVVVLGGLVLAVGYAVFVPASSAVVLWLALLAVADLLVAAVCCWRLVEVAVERFRRASGGGTP